MDEDKIHQGFIKFFKDSRGYGFIHDLEGGPDLFFHVRNCAETKLSYYAKIGLMIGKLIYFIEKSDEQDRRCVQSIWLAEN